MENGNYYKHRHRPNRRRRRARGGIISFKNVVSAVPGGSALLALWKATPQPIKDRFSVRKDLPPDVRALFKQYGDIPIASMAVCREPIKAGVAAALNLLSLGQFNRNMKALNYENMFHLYLQIKLIGAPVIYLEKNEVITAKKMSGDPKESLPVKIPPGVRPTINSLWKKTLDKFGDGIFAYDAVSCNCQRFVSDILSANDLMTVDLLDFVLQDGASVVPKYLAWFSRKVTDVAAIFDHVRKGTGLRGGSFSAYQLQSYEKYSVPDEKKYADLRELYGGLEQRVTDWVDQKVKLYDDLEDKRLIVLNGGQWGILWTPEAIAQAELWIEMMDPVVVQLEDFLEDLEEQMDVDMPLVGEGLHADQPFTSSAYRGGLARVYAGTRAEQEKKIADMNASNLMEKAAIGTALAAHVNDVKSLISAIAAKDKGKAMDLVQSLVKKTAGGPAGAVMASMVPFVVGLSDLISGHSKGEANTGEYMNRAFGAFPVIGPLVLDTLKSAFPIHSDEENKQWFDKSHALSRRVLEFRSRFSMDGPPPKSNTAWWSNKDNLWWLQRHPYPTQEEFNSVRGQYS